MSHIRVHSPIHPFPIQSTAHPDVTIDYQRLSRRNVQISLSGYCDHHVYCRSAIQITDSVYANGCCDQKQDRETRSIKSKDNLLYADFEDATFLPSADILALLD